jgi:uncharacterized protein (TIGR00730 family)
MKSVCVFCGSSAGHRPEFAAAADHFGAMLARRGMTLVYGGASRGLMGILADAALSAGGTVIGVLPRFLFDKEIGHTGLTELYVVGSMHERKERMAELADAFVALPGGLGTLDEMAEMMTWAQLGLHQKPCGFLQVGGFFDSLLAFLDRALADGFVGPEHRTKLFVDDEPERLLSRLAAAGATGR